MCLAARVGEQRLKGPDSRGPGSPACRGDLHTCQQPPDRTLVSRSSHPGKDEGARVQCRAERGAVGAEQGPLCGGTRGSQYTLLKGAFDTV